MRGILAALALATAAPAAAATADMAGNWTVDLRPSLTDKPYTQPMVLKIAADGAVTGSFYNSEILAGRSVSARGRDCVAFRTTDGSGLYHSSACLEGGKMVGTTWAEGRNFLFPWTAER
jgi:ABC-type sugar transport system substrate-binding protein